MAQGPDNQTGSWRQPLVEVVPLGKLRPMFTEVTAAHLQAIFDLPAKVMPAQPEPDYALLPTRGQYDAGSILLALAQGEGPPPLRLGLTAKDLCLPFLTHVFGEAQVEGCSAVVSLHRLQGPGPSAASPNSLERVAKVALHEIAHVMGLVHCQSGNCLMNFSADLDHLDRLNMSLCPRCQKHFHRQRTHLLVRAGRTEAQDTFQQAASA